MILASPHDKRDEAIRDLVWRLIFEQKFGIAYHLALAVESHYPNLSPKIPAWMVRAVAVGPWVLNAEGELSTVLAESFCKFDEKCFFAGDKRWNQAIRILILSASLRPALIAPTTNAAFILQQLHIKGLNQLWALMKILSTHGERA